MKLNTHVRFNDGTCKEAMQFYQSCIGGELSFMTVGDSPMASQMPPEKKEYVMHSTLIKNGIVLLSASDMMRDTATVGDNMSIMVESENEEEAQSIFSKVSEGGEVFTPLEKQFWGGLFGMVTDKYGVEWLVSYMMEIPK